MNDKELINHLQKKNAEYIETIQALKANNWISVKDRLPKCDKYGEAYVLVCMDDEFIATTTYIKKDGFELWADSGEVTHWMPLPEPPQRKRSPSYRK